MKDIKNFIKNKLMEEWEYKEKQVDGIVEKILAMDERILDAFESWMESGDMPDTPVIHDCTPEMLYKAYPLKPPAAFMLLDWIRRKPDEALAALQDEYSHLPWEYIEPKDGRGEKS